MTLQIADLMAIAAIIGLPFLPFLVGAARTLLKSKNLRPTYRDAYGFEGPVHRSPGPRLDS